MQYQWFKFKMPELSITYLLIILHIFRYSSGKHDVYYKYNRLSYIPKYTKNTYP